jgi:multiple sugar transport system permease protein
VFEIAPFHLFFWNTIKITVFVTAGVILVSSLGGYSLARFRFPLLPACLIILISGMMIPSQAMLIPLYSMFKTLGWLDKHISLIFPKIVSNTFIAMLFRQYFKSIPSEIDESATVDGCTPFGIYWRILMPISTPAIAAACIFLFRSNFNDFMRPLVFIHSDVKYTITLGLTIFRDEYNQIYSLTMAVTTLALIPVMVVYLAGQKYFIQGFITSGLKS